MEAELNLGDELTNNSFLYFLFKFLLVYLGIIMRAALNAVRRIMANNKLL